MTDHPEMRGAPDAHVVRDNWFGAEIEPLLRTAAEKCQDRGAAFFALVGELSEVQVVRSIPSAGISLDMFVAMKAADLGANVDGLILSILHHCRRTGTDYRNSVVLSLMAGEDLL